MVRRGTTGTAVRRRSAPRARGDLLGAATASACAVAVVALALGAIAPLASAPSRPAEAPDRCDDARGLLTVSSVLDRRADALAGQLIACVDEDRRSLTIHNRTPVVWVIGDPGVGGVVTQVGGVSGLLSSHASRSGRGLVLAPGASASVSAGAGRLAPRPDHEGTRLFLALTAIVEAQDSARSSAPPRAPRSAVRTAALRCALALVEEGGSLRAPDPAGLAEAAEDASCRGAWRKAERVARGDGWRLPPLPETVVDGSRTGADAARARAASEWFWASSAFSWGGVARPERAG